MIKKTIWWDLMKEAVGFTVCMFLFAGWFCALIFVLADIARHVALFFR